MSLSTPADTPVQIVVPDPAGPNARPLVSTERRLTPSWSVSTLKGKLEPITGIPSASQLLRIAAIDGSWTPMDDDGALLSSFPLHKGAMIEVVDTRPRGAQVNWGNVGEVEKYVMPEEDYARRNDSVMAWKKRQKLGRFDPGQKSVEGLGGARERGCVWVGVELDEPAGRNDGSVEVERDEGKSAVRLWEGRAKHGVLVRPEKVEAGDEWTVLDDLFDEDMEEI
ncbi:hypothetical protein DV737_g5444, partial [Chaetothyriales sp. CBS 132003]